ncbi:MAG: hypothetical protein B7Z80_17060 [Rhodospirillales bacterium 20-64-7]|nr:MAG: hypothetical protein B7Z80_17060 [Rhodospirillales bacterium 20-64-7]HQT79183.1 sterol desaturase family protein [Rhodopila sp.]
MIDGSAAQAWLGKFLHHFLSYDTYVVLLSWLSALIGAYITFVYRNGWAGWLDVTGFLRFCFPAAIVRSRSCRLDLLFTISTRFLYPVMITPILITSTLITQFTHDSLTTSLGARPALPDSLSLHIVALVVVVILADASSFLTHYLDHKVKVLWEFHKVHHAAEFLIPITNRRVHPVQELFDDTTLLLVVGLWLGAFTYAVGLRITDSVFLGMDAYFFANLLSFYHLRHSHIPMSYGRLENVFLSPAQHHLHHSCHVQHWDRNFGLLLSCWDRMAGTFSRSEQPEAILLGLPQVYRGQYNNLLQLYLTPVFNVFRMVVGGLAPARLRPLSPIEPMTADRQPGE